MGKQLGALLTALAGGGWRRRAGTEQSGETGSRQAIGGRSSSIDDAPAGLFTLDRDGSVVACNTRCARMLGASDVTALHGTRLDRLLADESARARWRGFVTGDASALELHARMRTVGGAESALIVLVERVVREGPIREREGPHEFSGAMCAANELSARVTELEREARLLREVIAAAPVGIATLSVDGRIGTVWNPAAEAMLGWPAHEVRGRPVPLLPAPLGLERDGPAIRTEVRRWRGDGASIDLSIGTARLMGDDDAVVAILEDVTDRLVHEGERRRLDEIVRATPDFVLIVDVEGRILYVNPSARARIGEPAIGMNAAKLLGVGWDARWRDEVVPMVAAGGSWGAELAFGGAEPLTASVVVVGHRAHDGRLAFLSVLARDISEQRSVENQLRQSQKLEALGQLTGGIAHDFNNLLTVVHANAELLLERASGADADLLGDIEHAAGRGRELVRRLMVFSRNDKLQLQSFRAAVLEDYIRTLRRLLPETVNVQWVCDDHDATILADPGAIEQVLLNLATNARDAMPAGGVLTIAVSTAAPDAVTISVTDTGTGMQPGVRDRIFEPFFTTKPPGSGTGLGLSMVYGLVRQLHGSLDVDSEPGRGTSFHMQFPRAAAASTQVSHAAAPHVGAAAAPAGSSILVVEDEAGIRRVLERSLTRVGHTVKAACDGVEALAVIRERDDIDLVICDVMMPHLGGPELLEILRAEGCTLPFLFMSGYAEKDTRDRARLGQEVLVLSKPWTAGELHAAVQCALENARAPALA